MTESQRQALRRLEQEYRLEEEYWTQHWSQRLAFYEGLKARYPSAKIGLPVDVASARHTRVVENGGVFSRDPTVVLLRSWLVGLCDREKIAVAYTLEPSLRNGIASTSNRCAVVAPLRSTETCTTLAHECGHILSPPSAHAVRVPTIAGRSACVEGELLAWRWAMGASPVWTRQMHDWLRRSLATYRDIGTPRERRAIDELSSNIQFNREELRRLVSGCGSV